MCKRMLLNIVQRGGRRRQTTGIKQEGKADRLPLLGCTAYKDTARKEKKQRKQAAG